MTGIASWKGLTNPVGTCFLKRAFHLMKEPPVLSSPDPAGSGSSLKARVRSVDNPRGSPVNGNDLSPLGASTGSVRPAPTKSTVLLLITAESRSEPDLTV